MFAYTREFLDAETAYRREQLSRAWPAERARLRRRRHRLDRGEPVVVHPAVPERAPAPAPAAAREVEAALAPQV